MKILTLLLLMLATTCQAGHGIDPLHPSIVPPWQQPGTLYPQSRVLVLRTRQYYLMQELVQLRASYTMTAPGGQLTLTAHHLGIPGYRIGGAGLGYSLSLREGIVAGILLEATSLASAEGWSVHPAARIGLCFSLSDDTWMGISASVPPQAWASMPMSGSLTARLMFRATETLEGCVSCFVDPGSGPGGEACILFRPAPAFMFWYRTGFHPFTQACGSVIAIRGTDLCLGFAYTGNGSFHPESGLLWARD